jgi:hypothetical protein
MALALPSSKSLSNSASLSISNLIALASASSAFDSRARWSFPSVERLKRSAATPPPKRVSDVSALAIPAISSMADWSPAPALARKSSALP